VGVTKAELERVLSFQDADALRAILEASGVTIRGGTTAPELAHRVADALWWNYCTPLGYVVERTTLEDMVAHVGRRLGATEALATGDVWEQLRNLTRALVRDLEGRAVELEDIDQKARSRIWPAWKRPLAFGTTAGGSFAARWGATQALGFLNGPIGRWLPYLPPLAPYVGGVKTGFTVVRALSGPLGVAFAVLAVNDSLGTNYQRLLPLLLGVGALGPQPGVEAEEVGGFAEG
jgi:hypothetical protein